MKMSSIEESKKRKIETSNNSTKVKTSKVFSPFRVIGHVSNGVPFAIGTLGSSFYIATVIGRSFQIYDASTLHLLFVSNKQTSDTITSIAAHFQYIYCSYGNKVGIFRRGRLEHELLLPITETINKVIVFGGYLIAYSSNKIHIFEKKVSTDKYATEFYTTIEVNKLFGDIVDIIHLPTYVNKIVVATTDHLILYNIKTTKLIFRSEEFVNGITTIEPAPALDILAIGDSQGNCTVYNIKKNKTLRTINTGSSSTVSSISFRTDGTPHIVMSLTNGDLFFYDLNKKSRVHVLRNAHKEQYGGCTKCQFLNGQPIIVTSGPDNSLKEFVFDPVLSDTNTSVVSPPRHLRSRGGHSAPPSSILFGDSRSHFIQSGSQDRSFWTFSLRKDAQAQEMSQKQSRTKNGKLQAGQSRTYKSKFPPITMIAQENNREGEWDNIVTAHQEESFARTWNSKNRKVGKYQLFTIDNGIVKSVAMSACGNFALVGSSNGGIGSFNMQSGILRKKYNLHKNAVTGIAIDSMNRKMVSCGLDGIVGFYDFANSKYLGKLVFDSPITQLVYHRSSDLFAITLDDLSIVVIDSVTQKIVRQLIGHTNRITAMDFSPDGRWIVSASLDSTIRTWDLPTGGCIDGIKLPNIVTCLKVSPQGEYLATGHVNDVGISLWTNKSQFKPVSTRHIEEEDFANMLLPNVSGDGGSSMIDGALDDEDNNDSNDGGEFGNYISTNKISDLLTFSHCSRNKFNTLLHLETIRNRNKPKEAPKKQENIPFFMELTGGKVGDKAIENELGKQENKFKDVNDDGSKLMSLDTNKEYLFETDFTKFLRLGKFSEFIKLVVDLSPANIDLEIRSIKVISPYEEIINFVNAITFGISTNENIEILISIMSMFLKNHSDVIYEIKKIVKNEEHDNYENAIQVVDALGKWSELNLERLEKLDTLTKYCSSVVTFITIN